MWIPLAVTMNMVAFWQAMIRMACSRAWLMTALLVRGCLVALSWVKWT